MFKKLSIKEIAQIIKCLLNDDKVLAISEIQQCIQIMFSESGNPKWRYKTNEEIKSGSFTLSHFDRFQNAEDCFIDCINSKLLSDAVLERLIEICMTNKPLTT